MRKRKKRIPPSIKKIYPILILASCIFMSVGYAAINEINMKINGTGISLDQPGVIITEVNYKTHSDAIPENSTINATTGTTLNSSIALSPLNSASTITYTITVYNNTEYNYRYDKTLFDEKFYTNPNIIFELGSNLNTNVVLLPDESITFDITFKYVNGVTPSTTTNKLSSYIKFVFAFEETVVGAFDYTGDSQIFTAPETGTYKIELWGAQGGSYEEWNGGYGAYSTGELTITKGETLYAYVGGQGTHTNVHAATISGGYNGGGKATTRWSSGASNNEHKSSGGGATHISTKKGTLSSNTDLESIYAVAAGGSGQIYFLNATPSYTYCTGGSGGGIEGSVGECESNMISEGRDYYILATQISPGMSSYSSQSSTGAYGQGGNGYSGGGGGLYGGGGGYVYSNGGSSYIGNIQLEEKHMTCYNCTTSEELDTKTISVETHSPTPIADTPKEGNGYLRITLLSPNDSSESTYINKAIYSTRDGALSQEKARIIKYANTTLISEVTLAPNTETSQVSIIATLHNNSNYTMTFNDIIYNEESTNAYTNTNIKYTFDNQGTVIESNQKLDVKITFTYVNGADLTQNTLLSTLNFKIYLKSKGEIVNLDNLASTTEASNVTITGENYTINEDGSINFTRNPSTITEVNNIILSNYNGDYSNGITIALDFYIDGTHLPSDGTSSNYQLLFMSRINREFGITAWYLDNCIVLDSGGNQLRTTHSLSGAGRYILLITYGGDLTGVTIINKTTNTIVSTQKTSYNLSLIEQGMQEVNYEFQLGADQYLTNNMSYQTDSGLKFYNFYVNNEGLNDDSYKALLGEFNFTTIVDTTNLK